MYKHQLFVYHRNRELEEALKIIHFKCLVSQRRQEIKENNDLQNSTQLYDEKAKNKTVAL